MQVQEGQIRMTCMAYSNDEPSLTAAERRAEVHYALLGR